MIVKIIRTAFFEDDVLEGDIDYSNAVTEEVPVESIEEAVALIRGEGLTFAATGNDWACHPDGSQIIDYYTAEREEVSAHAGDGWSDSDWFAVMDAVG